MGSLSAHHKNLVFVQQGLFPNLIIKRLESILRIYIYTHINTFTYTYIYILYIYSKDSKAKWGRNQEKAGCESTKKIQKVGTEHAKIER